MSTQVNMPLVQVHQLSIQHGHKTVLAPFDWTIRAGEHWAILGANGTGKTSVLHALLGIMPKVSKQIHMNGEPLSQISVKKQAERRIWIPQRYEEPFTLTVLQALNSVAQNIDSEKAIGILECYGLLHLAQHWVHTLSGGEHQRLTWAMSAARTNSDTQLWLLDEPFAAQDLAWQALLLKQLQASPCAVVTAIHDLNQVSQFASHVLLIKKSTNVPAQVIAQGCIADVMRADLLSNAYGVDVQLFEKDEQFWWQTA